ncbi:response regulator [Aequorivita sp. Q41]|uniref:response regulator n=1 Tax=Aequorivita sp. Q41 TaxID=3153300 RepID=UPI0032425AD2
MKNLYSICVIDDDKIYQYTVSKILKANELAKNILVFSDGEEALDFFIENQNAKENLPDIILLDINMPIMDGFQFMDEYVKLKPNIEKDIEIFMVSSSVDASDVELSNRITEISDYIVKPIKSDEVISLVSTFHDKRKN